MRRCICVMIGIVFALSAGSTIVRAFAIDAISLTSDEQDVFLEKIQWERVDVDSYKNSISGFDVSQDGMVALAIVGDAVYVYDPSGAFLYGYQFDAHGDFGIEFREGMLLIYFLRGNNILYLGNNGQYVTIHKANNVNQFVMNMKEILSSTHKSIEGKHYFLERDINIGGSYSRLVVEEDEERIVLYDVTIDHMIKQVGLIVCILFFVTYTTAGVVKKHKHNNEA